MRKISIIKRAFARGVIILFYFCGLRYQFVKLYIQAFFFIKVLINGDELLILNAHVLNHLIFMIKKKTIPFINTIIKKNQLVQNKIT